MEPCFPLKLPSNTATWSKQEWGDEEKARGSQVGAIGPVNVLHPHLIQMFKLGHRGHGGVVLMVNSVQILCVFIANFLENDDAFDISQW